MARVMNHVRDQVYKTVANPKLTPAEKADALKRLADVDAQADTIKNTQTMGPLGGVADTHLRPDIAPKVPAGAARPYAPGEYTDNPDRSWSSERSMTVQKPDGSWTVVPSLWLKDGKPYEAKGEGEALRLAKQSKLPFKSFPSLKTADQFAIDREAAWQPIQNPADADKIPPLWAGGGGSPMGPRAPMPPNPMAIAAAANQTAAGIAGPTVQYPQSVAALPPVAAPPTAAFGPAPPAPAPSITAPNPFAVGSEIDRQKALALAALGKPTTYPVPQ